MRIFIGHDPRTAIATNVCTSSFYRRASRPVEITPLVLPQLPLERRGLTEFTYSRFLVPYLCGYEGWALFVDSDTICTTDINEILAYADPKYAVMGVDTNPAFERAAVMLFNCAHPDNERLTPTFIDMAENNTLLGLEWTKNAGKLPEDYNHCIGYAPEIYAIDNGDVPPLPRVLHYTMGIPVWKETANCPYADVWHAERRAMCGVTTWEDLMAKSVHKPDWLPAKDSNLDR